MSQPSSKTGSLFVVLGSLELERLLGVGPSSPDQEAIEAQLALLAEHEGNVAVERQVEASAGVEFFGALDRDRTVPVEWLEQVQSVFAVFEPRRIIVEDFLARELWIVALLCVERQRPSDGLGLVPARPGHGARTFESVCHRDNKAAPRG